MSLNNIVININHEGDDPTLDGYLEVFKRGKLMGTVSSSTSGNTATTTTKPAPKAETTKTQTTTPSKPEAKAPTTKTPPQSTTQTTQNEQSSKNIQQKAAAPTTSETFKALDQAVTKDASASQAANSSKKDTGGPLKETRERIGNFFNKAKNTAGKVSEGVSEFADDVQEKGLGNAVREDFQQGINAVQEKSEDVLDSIADSSVGRSVSNTLDNIGEGANDLMEAAGDKLNETGDAIANSAVGQFVGNTVDTIGYGIKGTAMAYDEQQVFTRLKEEPTQFAKDVAEGMHASYTQREEMIDATREEYANYKPEKLETVEDARNALEFLENREEDKTKGLFGRTAGLFTHGDDLMSSNNDQIATILEQYDGVDGSTALSKTQIAALESMIESNNEHYQNFIGTKKTTADILGTSAAIVGGIGVGTVAAKGVAASAPAWVPYAVGAGAGGITGAILKPTVKQLALNEINDNSGVSDYVLLSDEGAADVVTGFMAGSTEYLGAQAGAVLATKVGASSLIGANGARVLGALTKPTVSGTVDVVNYNVGKYTTTGELASPGENASIFAIGASAQGLADGIHNGAHSIVNSLGSGPSPTTQLSRFLNNSSLGDIATPRPGTSLLDVDPFDIAPGRLADAPGITSAEAGLQSGNGAFRNALQNGSDSAFNFLTNRKLIRPIGKNVGRNASRTVLPELANRLSRSINMPQTNPTTSMGFLGTRTAQESSKAVNQNQSTDQETRNIWNLWGALNPVPPAVATTEVSNS